MILLTIRSDKPDAELGLFDSVTQLSYITWPAHRQLAETVNIKIKQLLDDQYKSLKDLQAVVVYKGPGSFTGLRIGLSVANALAYALNIPVVSETGPQWIKKGTARLQNGENEMIALPEYGSPPHITRPKH